MATQQLVNLFATTLNPVLDVASRVCAASRMWLPPPACTRPIPHARGLFAPRAASLACVRALHHLRDATVCNAQPRELARLKVQPGTVLAVLQVLTTAVDLAVRQSAAVFKNLVKGHWNPEDETAFTIAADTKTRVKNGLLSLFLSVPAKLQASSESMSLVATHDFPAAWPNLLGELVEQLSAAAGDAARLREGGRAARDRALDHQPLPPRVQVGRALRRDQDGARRLPGAAAPAGGPLGGRPAGGDGGGQGAVHDAAVGADADREALLRPLRAGPPRVL